MQGYSAEEIHLLQPDLVNRLRLNLPLTPYNRDTFYTHGPEAIEGELLVVCGRLFAAVRFVCDCKLINMLAGYNDYPNFTQTGASHGDFKDIRNLVQALATTVAA